jgi:hypothetical protein
MTEAVEEAIGGVHCSGGGIFGPIVSTLPVAGSMA